MSTTINAWQLQEIENAITEADKGDFASEQDVQKVVEKWEVDASQVVSKVRINKAVCQRSSLAQALVG
ncbi:MAG TPA: hypothetical protein VIC08_01355 [Cellvibrionaceae bacterium]